MGRLDDKVAVITGATSGIGRRTAELFAKEGAYVVVSGRRQVEGQALASSLGPQALYVSADVAEDEQVENLIQTAMDKFGRIDCLFNNAGIPGKAGGVENLEGGQINSELAVLINGVLYGMKHVAPIMKRQGSGTIINTGSIAGQRAGYGVSLVYSLAKAAVIHASKCVAMELAEHKIRVNSLSPGAIVTGIFGKAFGLDDAQADADGATDDLLDRFNGAQPYPRAGIAEDIARAALFLASDDSEFVTGTDILVDGGMIAGRRWSETMARWEGLSQALAQT
ncbi:MAG: Levodione reductase [Alphaproteobacteria bacterium MarineAlpha9_Bin5]|nr:MAG: Levodione reductase [Alphaproteobacteria bacterium MarineAlpha9_Bin5]HHZ67127.1 glucose 1-dehydrogenase [Alphaproteobacteria bacterium]HIA21731.1 glucose 1-dehydrogenase [Alphaproteobacteria bacterium]HIB17895.1 glucose 1-dehydrogenase [Alphaproteobacteria bacterium]HIB57329.1 glucose 1-dehydrogenase [Alphaproteobacteria bacterium]